MKYSVKVTIIMSSILLAGCSSLTTAYVRPSIPNAPYWADAPGDTSPLATANWWQTFGDTELNKLVSSVLANNNDILAAAIRARKATLQAERSGVALMPTLTGSGNGQTLVALGNGTGTNAFSLALGASYEVDLWGRLSSEKDIARLQAVAALEDTMAARTTVVASTIETYFRLAHANQNLAAARESLATAQKSADLVASQSAAGAATELELAEVRQTVETQGALVTDQQQVRVVLRNALAILLNGQPSPITEPTNMPKRTPVMISAGLPADILSRRPDLRAAELRLRSTLREVDGARANLYPQISLTGNLGASSSDLIDILANPMLSLGSGILLPFLNFKDADLKVRVSETEYELAVAEFRLRLLSSFGEVSNALSARTFLAEKAKRLRSALASAIEAEELTEQRYRAGSITLRLWLDAQERRRTAERANASNRLEQLVTEVQIFRVLGGTPDVPTSP